MQVVYEFLSFRVDWVQLRHFLCFNFSHKNRYWKDVNFHMTCHMTFH